MQLLPALSGGARTVERERSAGVHLPYARNIDDHTLETREGLLPQVIDLRGLLFQSTHTAGMSRFKASRVAMWR